MSRHADLPSSLRSALIGRRIGVIVGTPYLSRKRAKFWVWMLRYSTGVPAANVPRSIEHNNVEPVRSTEATTSNFLVSTPQILEERVIADTVLRQ